MTFSFLAHSLLTWGINISLGKYWLPLDALSSISCLYVSDSERFYNCIYCMQIDFNSDLVLQSFSFFKISLTVKGLGYKNSFPLGSLEMGFLINVK